MNHAAELVAVDARIARARDRSHEARLVMLAATEAYETAWSAVLLLEGRAAGMRAVMDTTVVPEPAPAVDERPVVTVDDMEVFVHKGGRPRLTDYAEVARVARDGVALGHSMQQSVAKHFGITLGAAKARIKAARAHGEDLPDGRPGRKRRAESDIGRGDSTPDVAKPEPPQVTDDDEPEVEPRPRVTIEPARRAAPVKPAPPQPTFGEPTRAPRDLMRRRLNAPDVPCPPLGEIAEVARRDSLDPVGELVAVWKVSRAQALTWINRARGEGWEIPNVLRTA